MSGSETGCSGTSEGGTPPSGSPRSKALTDEAKAEVEDLLATQMKMFIEAWDKKAEKSASQALKAAEFASARAQSLGTVLEEKIHDQGARMDGVEKELRRIISDQKGRIESLKRDLIEEKKRMAELNSRLVKVEDLLERMRFAAQKEEEESAQKEAAKQSGAFNVAIIRSSTASSTCPKLEETLVAALNDMCDLQCERVVESSGWFSALASVFSSKPNQKKVVVKTPIVLEKHPATFSAEELKRSGCKMAIIVAYTASARIESSSILETRDHLERLSIPNAIIVLRYGEKAAPVDIKGTNDAPAPNCYSVAFQTDGILRQNDMTKHALAGISSMIKRLYAS